MTATPRATNSPQSHETTDMQTIIETQAAIIRQHQATEAALRTELAECRDLAAHTIDYERAQSNRLQKQLDKLQADVATAMEAMKPYLDSPVSLINDPGDPLRIHSSAGVTEVQAVLRAALPSITRILNMDDGVFVA